MASVDDLGEALQHLMGARQALARIVAEDVDDTLTSAAYLEDGRLEAQWARLASVLNWRRRVER